MHESDDWGLLRLRKAKVLDETVETIELDGKLKLGKELVDAVMPVEPTVAAAAVLSTWLHCSRGNTSK